MKKRLSVCVLALVCLLLLSACGCKHEWTEADCLTPKTCTQCQETEGEPLGHDFAAATCIAPETCSRCGETRAEALGHTYGDWAMAENETMIRSCITCGTEESAPVDYELFLRQKLAGHWDFGLQSTNSQTYSAYDLKTGYLGTYLSFSGENNGTLYLDNVGEMPITWEFDHYEMIEGTPYYYFVITIEEMGQNLVALVEQPGGTDLLLLLTGNGDYIALFPNQELVSAMAGTWAASENGEVHILTLNADRTVSGDLLGKEITGTWHLKPDTIQYGYRSAELMVRYTVEDVAHTASGNIDLGSADMEMEEYLEYYSGNLCVYLREGDVSYSYDRMDETGIAALKTALAEGKQKLVGPWTSSYVYTYNFSSSQSNQTDTEDYSITFSEDGSFIAALDKERKGTWIFTDANVNDGYTSYRYELTFEGVQDTVYANIYSDGELQFGKSNQSASTSIYFLQMTEEKIAEREAAQAEATKMITGNWNSLSLSTYASDGSNYQSRSALDYTITFANDGTFTAMLDKEYAGTWLYDNKYVYDDPNYHSMIYQYRLTFDDVSGSIDGNLSIEGTIDAAAADPVKNGRFSISISDQNGGRNVEFRMLSAETMEMIRKAPEKLVGTWNTVSAYCYNESYQTSTELTDCAYTMTMSADGTFTAQFDQPYAGTWEYYYEPNNPSMYRFVFDGSSNGNLYTLAEDGTLEIWHNVGTDYISAKLKKD